VKPEIDTNCKIINKKKMKKEEAEKIAIDKEKDLKGTYFTNKIRGGKYLIYNVISFENPIDSNDFQVYIGFERVNGDQMLLDPLDLFFMAYKKSESNS
jgi:hypothetical protein